VPTLPVNSPSQLLLDLYHKNITMGYVTVAFFGVIMTSIYQTALSATTTAPSSTDSTEAPDQDLAQEILDFIRDNPEYMAMIGMGIVIVLLFITAVCAICLLSGRRSENYKK